jgi:AraC-like DNA-binding protein
MKHLGFASIPAVQQYLRYAESKQVDTHQLILDSGIDPNVMASANGRIIGTQFQSLIKHLIEQSNDSLMGLHSSQFVQPGSYSVLGYITMSCATIGDAMDKIQPYERLVGDMGTTSFQDLGSSLLQQWHCIYDDTSVRPHMIDNVLASWTTFARWLANQDASPEKILFQRSAPSVEIQQEYQAFFKAELEFNADCDGIILSKDLLSISLRQPDNLLLKTLESHAKEQIAHLEQNSASFSEKVKAIIQNQLNMGSARKELVATELNMTERTLQRKLVSEKTSYQNLLNEVRFELASELLKSSEIGIQDIAYNLGFADGRSFHRSFKNWTGVTPGQFREKQQLV